MFCAGLLVLAAGCGALYAVNPRHGRKAARPTAVRQVAAPPAEVKDPRQGKLAWPAVGGVVGTFGLVVDPTYGTRTKKLGLDIQCAKGSPVKAAYDGRVSFADQFMGYGRTVIVDHGDRLHSIYSKLDEIKVSVGMRVKQGDIIAFSGDTLHFQVRMAGQSVDPQQWLVPR